MIDCIVMKDKPEECIIPGCPGRGLVNELITIDSKRFMIQVCPQCKTRFVKRSVAQKYPGCFNDIVKTKRIDKALTEKTADKEISVSQKRKEPLNEIETRIYRWEKDIASQRI